jgi:DNA-binding PadR family transcriptional regulator
MSPERIYRLTARGRQCLPRWPDRLAKYQEMLEDLLTRAKESIEVTETL